MPRPESVNSRPREAQSFTGLGRLRQDWVEGPYHTELTEEFAASSSRPPSGAGPPKRRLCASTALAAEVHVPLYSLVLVSAGLALALLPPPPPRLGADLDSSRTRHPAPPASSEPRNASRRERHPNEGIALTEPPSFTKAWMTFGGVFGRSHPGGARGVSCSASSPVQSRPWRRRRPTSRMARDFSVCLAINGPLVCAAAAAVAAERGDGGALGSWKDSNASRSGKRTGGGGSCQSNGPGPGRDLCKWPRASLLPLYSVNPPLWPCSTPALIATWRRRSFARSMNWAMPGRLLTESACGQA
mmetsp:Transcript_104641/g.325161  ORF Transcript_104641/g.325161 Transcript_104641/m.325161 type:complete len:301 (+) Transcript_104641:429-1331(+)